MTSQSKYDKSRVDPKDTKWVDYCIYQRPNKNGQRCASFKVDEEAIDKGLYKRNAMYITDEMGWFHQVTEEEVAAFYKEEA